MPAAAAARAVGGGGLRRDATGRPRAAGPLPASFRDVVALVAEQREAMLHAHLLHSVHLVRFAPPVIELRPEPEAPRDLAVAARRPAAGRDRHAAGPSRCPPTPGEPTLAEQGNAADAAARGAPPIIRWCAPSWRRSPAPVSTRCTTLRSTPTACRRRPETGPCRPSEYG